MAKQWVSFFALAFIVFVLAISETQTVKGELCEKASKTWSGNCGNTKHCDDQCKSWEGAAHGACHVRNGKHMCFCYFNSCAEADKLSEDQIEAGKLAFEKAEKLDRDVKKAVPNVDHP
ncbi:defensin-like protein 19 [Cynara cardunculus var. scolymus]|uniref:Gamma thionin n=1 Tax=Cynara cardunculus var. scolymus TaxID=59895 RepID=A0A118K6H9_CYNCS|nr:defensin-like protein 19 [Cynara cardunculus var. scolymus]KVI10698.1 Gamma thionin [Cynara cardunculus var. scolymus]